MRIVCVEERLFTFVLSSQQNILVVWHTNRGKIIRIYWRTAPKRGERRSYESGQ